MIGAILAAAVAGVIAFSGIWLLGWLIQTFFHTGKSYHWVALVIAILVAGYEFLNYLGR